MKMQTKSVEKNSAESFSFKPNIFQFSISPNRVLHLIIFFGAYVIHVFVCIFQSTCLSMLLNQTGFLKSSPMVLCFHMVSAPVDLIQGIGYRDRKHGHGKNECSSKIGLSLNFCMLISETLIWSRFHDLDGLGSRSGGCYGFS